MNKDKFKQFELLKKRHQELTQKGQESQLSIEEEDELIDIDDKLEHLLGIPPLPRVLKTRSFLNQLTKLNEQSEKILIKLEEKTKINDELSGKE